MPGTYYTRCAAAGIVILIVWGILEGVLLGFISPAAAGWSMFRILSYLLLGFVLFEGAWKAADALSREKREGTLGLIFLTPLRPGEIVFSKLVACGMRPLFALLALVPVPSLSFFLGGLNWGDYLRMMIALANGLFVSLATGLLVSACSRRERPAIAAALVCLLGLCFIAPALGILFWSLAEIWKSPLVSCLAIPLLACGPSTAVLSVLNETTLIPAQMAFVSTYALSLAVSHALGWCFLALAARMLKATWQEEVLLPGPQGETESSDAFWAVKAIRSGVSRYAGDRRAIAVRLAERSMTPCYVWYSGIIVLIVALGIGYALFGPKITNWVVIVGSLLFLHWCLKLDLAIQATRALSEERRTGALEILLTTPLDPEEIVRGRLLALKRRFLAPMLALVLVDLIALCTIAVRSGLNTSWELMVVCLGVSVVVIFQLAGMYTLSWWGLWMGYRHDEPGRALRNTLLSLVLGPPLLLALFVALPVLILSPNLVNTPAFGAFLIGGWIVAMWMTTLSLCARAIGGLRDQFRETAASVEAREGLPAWAERIFNPKSGS